MSEKRGKKFRRSRATKKDLMSVCVSSSSISSGMSHVSHLHLTSTLSMMQPFQNHHQMATSQLQMQNSSSSSSSDASEPNSEMLLALIARNKTLEGELKNFAVGKRKQKKLFRVNWQRTRFRNAYRWRSLGKHVALGLEMFLFWIPFNWRIATQWRLLVQLISVLDVFTFSVH